ncbi:MAG: DNA glycosylase AlkZ-like family protein, partial [Anaerolineae bacterium]
RHPLMEKKLFAWDYGLECYLPAEKRTYGYVALPILWSDRFIGRVDAKADRKSHTLIVRQLTVEADFAAYGEVLPLLTDRLGEFARFNACGAFVVEHVDPSWLAQPMERVLR